MNLLFRWNKFSPAMSIPRKPCSFCLGKKGGIPKAESLEEIKRLQERQSKVKAW
jgi:hypothetical protein